MAASDDKYLGDDIPSAYLQRFDSVTRDSWQHNDFRKRILEIVEEHECTNNFGDRVERGFNRQLETTTFTTKVKSIASAEVRDYIDKSRTKTIFWIAGIVAAAVVGLVVQKIWNVF